MTAVQIVSPDRARPLPLVDGDGEAVALVWPGMGAEHRSMHRFRLGALARTSTQYHAGEAVYYVAEGSAQVRGGDQRPHSLQTGAMVHIAPRTTYRFEAGDIGAVLFGGPCPPDPSLYGREGDDTGDLEPHPVVTPTGIRTFHRDRPSLYAEIISRDARFVVWPGVGADHANMNYVRMEPGERNQPHAHTASEDTIVILAGRGNVDDLTNDERHHFQVGQVIHVPAGVRHAVCADEGVAIESVGGPCPPDWALLEMLGYRRASGRGAET